MHEGNTICPKCGKDLRTVEESEPLWLNRANWYCSEECARRDGYWGGTL